MCLERAQLEDYHHNNYSGLTPASGLLANDRHNTNGWISSCLFACVCRMHVQALCVFACVSPDSSKNILGIYISDIFCSEAERQCM